MLSGLWGKITGADKKRQLPNQQAEILGRKGDYTVLFPYGLYVDLPNDAFIKSHGTDSVISVTTTRPTDTAVSEPTLFHAATNTRIILRNNGDLDIITTQGGGNVNIQTVDANITASGAVNVDAASASITASGAVDVDAASVTLTAALTTIDGSLVVTGGAVFNSTMTNLGVNIGGTHNHNQGNDSDGDTQQNTGPPM